MTDHFLHTNDFNFAPFSPCTGNGDSGMLQLATSKRSSDLQYIVKNATPELVSLSACKNDNEQTETPAHESGTLTVMFDFEKQSGYASNQFAVWIEDADGKHIKTLYAMRFTTNGGYKTRPDTIPAWVETSGLESMQKNEVDAITGATPKAGTLSYVWNLTDANGDTVPSGEYSFFVEGSLRWKNRVLYTGAIEVGDAPTTAEASDDQPALTSESPENSMIGAVTANYAPAVQN